MRKFVNKIKFLSALILLISIIVAIVINEALMTKSLSATNVTLSFIPAPNIDVVLAKGKTTTNVNSFKSDLLTSLGELGIDTTKVNISSVSTENVNMQSAFSWNQDLSSSIGAITINNNGQSVSMVGNRTNAGKNAIYIVPTDNQEQEFTFNYNINYGDSFRAAGMLLKVSRSGSTLTGYMLSFNKSGQTYYQQSSNKLGAIWKFSWVIGANSTNMNFGTTSSAASANSCQLVKGLDINQRGSLTVSVDSGYIKVSGGGLSTTETIATESSYDGIGFGFFSDHYSHSCDSIGSFALTNINLRKTTVKKLSEVLREPDWRSDAIKVVVNVSDYISDELNNNSTRGELLTRLINEELYFAAWGNSVNQSQFQNLIASNNGNGKFINNTNYNNSISQTAQYIKTLIDQLKGNDNYLILGEPIKISSSPAGVLVNTAGGTYPYGRWKITHNYQYFENDLGQFSRANQYLNNMITEFDKTGEFKITYEDQAITPQSVYVHRRPFAIINHNKTGLTLNLSSASYDLDKYSNNTPLPNGIAQEEWKYKKTTETTWKSGKLTTLEANADYIIQLRVKDLQGAWSAPASVYTTNDASVLPIAYFSIEDDEISKWETLKINDTSYDPYGGKITSRYWEVYKNGTRVHAGSTAKVNGYTETGVYVMKLRVTNDRGKTSEFFSRTFQITDDTTAPSIIINPEKGGWAQYIDVKVSFNDSQSGFKSYQYAITDSQTAATTGWSSAITKSSDTIRINTGGNKYLHIKATDNAGNVSDERITGIYYIDVTAPKIIPTQETKTEIDKTTVKLTITDSQSGVKSITVDNKNVTSGSVTFTKNGVYTVVATDNAGNVSKMNINVTNVYYHCNAGLGHPDYSSSLDGCPICASYKGLAVTNTSNVYDGNNHRVKYNNPKGATIVEYYNGSKTNVPKKVGNYSYELKVVYNGVEYRTGVTGTYSVTKKTITITGIKSPNKIYDGNDRMTLTGGILNGVCAGDTVGFTLPSVSYAENKNVGNHKIRLGSNIVLTGQDAYNYTLTQPTYGSITGNIVKRTITVSGVQGKTRKYNKTNVMEIIGGTIVNGVAGDDISLNIPKTGIAESANTGNWKIKIDDIVLQGTDAKNYTLKQPEEVRGTIEKETGVLKINCNSKVYDSIAVEPYVVSNNSTSSVTYKYYKAGTNEEVSKPSKVGKYEVVGSMISDGNYTEATTEKIPFEITTKTITIKGITSPDKIYDGNDKMTVTNGELVGVCAGDTVGFTLPSVSYAESKNVGNHKIRLGSDIVLTGQDAYNYTLTQPTYGSITGNIVKRTITVSGVQGKTRRYNKTNVMEIIGGTIVNGVAGDDISLNIPKTGIAESANTGNWKIKIDDIVLQGTDAKNYTLIQPEEVRGTIEKEIGVLKINCDSKIYNKEYSVPYVTENNSTARVTYKFYIEGSDEEIEVPRDVGKYEVVGSMISDGNYTEATTERIKFEITQKDITIVDIVVPNKIYNGTKNFSVTGGKLVGVYGGDDVSFSLPYLGYSESKDIGNYKIKLDDITLNGKQANNYHLIQPTYGSITSNIGKKQISTKGIHAENKKYDKNNVVSISGGELVGMVENDDVILKVPTEGTAEKAETGEWIVKIDDVTIEGKDAKNYELIQPEQFKVTIEKADGKIKIGCEGKKFDREKIEPFVIENNSGGNVTFKYYIAGTSTQVEKPSEIGKYDIIATLEGTDNYTSDTSERYTVEITDPDSPNLKVESVINTVNGTEIDEIKEVNVHYTDTIKVKIKVKNTGVGSGYLSKLSTTIPKGMELVEDSEINKKYKWTEVDGKLETTMFSFKENFESEIYNKGQNDTEQLIELELELKVIIDDKESANMILPFEIEQQNKHGDIVEYDETSKENSKDEVNAKLKYFDVSIDKTITLLSLTYAESGETEDFNIYQRKGSPIKMEVSEMRANSSYAKLKYKITLVNNGTGEGTVDKVIDVIPKGTIFEQEDNPDWTLDNDGNAIYNKKITLSENQMKEIEIVLKWDLRNYNLGTRRNQVFFDAPGEIDQILTNEEKVTLEKTDNFAYSEMVFSLPTGSESIMYILIAIMIVTTLGVGIVLIKKYVTK